MTQSLLNKVWSFLAVLLLYLCLNVWSITQQWQLSFPGNPFKTENVTPHGATIYGVPICGMLLGLTSTVTRIYALRSPKTRWEGRLPRFGDFELLIESLARNMVGFVSENEVEPVDGDESEEG